MLEEIDNGLSEPKACSIRKKIYCDCVKSWPKRMGILEEEGENRRAFGGQFKQKPGAFSGKLRKAEG